MLGNIELFFKTLYQRAFLSGAAIPPDQGWRAYVPSLSSAFILTLFSALILLDPNMELWRAMLSWSLIGASLLGLFLGIGWIQGYHRRDEVAPELREAPEVDSSNYLRIAMTAAFVAPPIARLILGLFGWQP